MRHCWSAVAVTARGSGRSRLDGIVSCGAAPWFGVESDGPAVPGEADAERGGHAFAEVLVESNRLGRELSKRGERPPSIVLTMMMPYRPRRRRSRSLENGAHRQGPASMISAVTFPVTFLEGISCDRNAANAASRREFAFSKRS